MLTGLNLSLCVLDIAFGRVQEKEVALIIAGTKCATEEDWDNVLSQYREFHWYEKPNECEEIARRLIRQGKVIQPHLVGGAVPSIASGHWLDENGGYVRL